jgi:hypothetical protein
MIHFREMARRHWEKYLPSLTKALKEEGIWEQELESAAEQASRELAIMVSKGAQLEACKEIVLKEYIFLPPETADNDSIEEPDEED